MPHTSDTSSLTATSATRSTSDYDSSAVTTPRTSRSSRGRTTTRGRRSRRSSMSSRSTRSGASSAQRRLRRRRRESRRRSDRSGLAVTDFTPCQDADTLEEMRAFLTDYSRAEQFESFTLKIDGVPFVAVSLLNAEHELRSKYWAMPPPTPMRPSRNGENRPRKRTLSSNATSLSSSGQKSRKSVRFPDEKISGEDVERVLDGIVKQQKSYSDLWADREQGK